MITAAVHKILHQFGDYGSIVYSGIYINLVGAVFYKFFSAFYHAVYMVHRLIQLKNVKCRDINHAYIGKIGIRNAFFHKEGIDIGNIESHPSLVVVVVLLLHFDIKHAPRFIGAEHIQNHRMGVNVSQKSLRLTAFYL